MTVQVGTMLIPPKDSSDCPLIAGVTITTTIGITDRPYVAIVCREYSVEIPCCFDTVFEPEGLI